MRHFNKTLFSSFKSPLFHHFIAKWVKIRKKINTIVYVLYLTSCGYIEFLNKIKYNSQWNDNCDEINIGITYNDNCAKHTQKLTDQSSEDSRNSHIHNVNILKMKTQKKINNYLRIWSKTLNFGLYVYLLC